MICKPFRLCSKNTITQVFGAIQGFDGKPHTGVDFVAEAGTILVAPELCKVVNIVDAPSKIDNDETAMSKGFGIVMKSQSQQDVYYLYWHCAPVFPVNIGDTVTQGQPVATMSNSGFCMSRGVLVPIDIRNIPPYIGTHLHAERFTEINGDVSTRTYTDITKYIDWSIPVKPSNNALIDAIANMLGKIANMLKK